MHVVATAGHVDHGKSALVRALTGRDPDRLEEEHRRGLSIQLGYAWTRLPDVGDVAFVDVPGHERFISTMLAGIGPVPAVLLVVAADDPWMPQAAEHLAALDALSVEHAVVAVTRSDLADPGPAIARAAAEVGSTSLRGAPVVAVSSRTGAGLSELRDRLVKLVLALPDADPKADVRLWVDRRFTVSGAGTVVTGTLPAGTLARGDLLSTGTGTVRVRGVESLDRPADSVSGVARVALNLTGDVQEVQRASILTTPEAYFWTRTFDARVAGGRTPPTLPMLHVGAVSLEVRCRPLAGDLVRLTLSRALPLRVGDRGLLRDPGSRDVWGVQVLDPLPPSLDRRGAAARRARALRTVTGRPDLVSEVERREVVQVDALRRIGVTDAAAGAGVVRAGSWLISPDRAERANGQILQAVTKHARERPLVRGVPLAVLADSLNLPSTDVVTAVVRAPLQVVGGRVQAPGVEGLPAEVEQALAALAADLADSPFSAPTADRLRELGLDMARTAAAARTGRLLRLAPGVVLLPGADSRAVDLLRQLPQPFTTSEARSRLGTTRRVILPLLEHLDRARLTRRLPDDRRLVL
jgi:selenocysteine-specific elongation factor